MLLQDAPTDSRSTRETDSAIAVALDTAVNICLHPFPWRTCLSLISGEVCQLSWTDATEKPQNHPQHRRYDSQAARLGGKIVDDARCGDVERRGGGAWR